jgi:hypothetical protein
MHQRVETQDTPQTEVQQTRHSHRVRERRDRITPRALRSIFALLSPRSHRRCIHSWMLLRMPVSDRRFARDLMDSRLSESQSVSVVLPLIWSSSLACARLASLLLSPASPLVPADCVREASERSELKQRTGGRPLTVHAHTDRMTHATIRDTHPSTMVEDGGYRSACAVVVAIR